MGPSHGDTPTGAEASKKIDAMLTELGDWRGATLTKLRNLILEADPQVEEQWKWMGSPVWSNNGIYAVGNAHKSKVKITFSEGVHLDDPKKLLTEGNGKTWRAIDLYEGDSVDTSAFKAAFKSVIRSAVAYNAKRASVKPKD